MVTRFNGTIPDNLKDLLSLPGIGRYTAGAILSIAFNRETPVLDGNVKRVLCRLYAIPEDPKETKTEERLWSISGSLIPEGNAHSFNQALMELGATICIPRKPLCLLCPLRNFCRARKQGNSEVYPKQVVKKRIPHVEAVSAVIFKEGRVLLRQRPPRGLLGGLWEFPNWKVEKDKELKTSLRKRLKEEMGGGVKVTDPVGTLQHAYSHFKVTLHVYRCRIFYGEVRGRWVSLQNLHLFPMSKLHRRIADTLAQT